MSNGVRNLRAMFENGNAAASPEPRGRSPTDSAAAPEGEERPKSKVRASFVSVEPTAAHQSTDLGQTKGTPSNSVNATRRESFRVSQDKTDELAELKKVVSEEKEQRRQSIAIPEAVPEQAVASRESSMPAPPIRDDTPTNMPNLGSIMKGSDFPESAAAARIEPDVAVPAPELEQVPVDETPVPAPEAAPAQPAENPDKATTGAQEDVALRPAAPTEEAVEDEDKPALADAALDDDAVVAEENVIAEEAAVVEEAAIAEEAEAVQAEAAATEEPSAPAPAAAQPAENPDTAVTGAQEELALRPAAPTDEAAVPDATASAPAEAVTAPSTEPAPETATPVVTKAKANGTPGLKKPEIRKPAAISTAKPAKAPAAPAKSPLPKAAPKTPTKPKTAAPTIKPSPAAKTTKPAAPKETAKAPVAKATTTKVPAAKTSRTSLRPAASSSSGTAPTAAAASKTKPAAAPVENKKPAIPKPTTSAPRKSTSPTGFKKPTPKSPTRPVGLPTRLTAPTAASAAKHGEEPKVTRKPSTNTRPTPKAPAPKTSRPSIAPPAPKRPESRTSTASAAPKGGFLERMMRPTAASSSKTHDKPHEKPSSPPRKAPAASKIGTLQKGKKKAEEVVSKAKAVVTNGNAEGRKDGDEAAKESEHDDLTTEEPIANGPSHESEKPATPVQEVDSSVAELQTPNFPEETVR